MNANYHGHQYCDNKPTERRRTIERAEPKILEPLLSELEIDPKSETRKPRNAKILP